MKKILFFAVLVFCRPWEVQAQVGNKAEGSPAKIIDITLSVPRPFTATGDAEKIFGPGARDANSELNIEGDATYYLSPNFQVGLCYKYDHKILYGPVSIGGDAAFITDMNALLTRWQVRLPLSGQFDVNAFLGLGLYMVSGSYEDNPLAYPSALPYRLNGQSFGGDVGLSFFFNFAEDFALGVQGGYQYAPVGSLTLDRPSPYLNMSGNQVMNQDGSAGVIDFSGLFINFMSLRVSL